ncbi:MAG: metal ABC transporter ATP-binding protein [bacterium]|nr:metal ABC transporter ATP-binding protein [bacterium]
MIRESEELILEVKNVTVSYSNGQVALFDASLKLNAGTICGLVGINGSGKSTLFKAIMGFVTPTQGTVLISGKPIKEALKKSLVSYVPQSEDIDWAFPVSVWDVVLMGRYGFMNFLRIPSAQDKRIALESLERVKMAEFRDRQIGELSGGQRKRVFLARALAQQGRLVLLDEPFTGIDVTTENTIIDLMQELRKEKHIILVSTHNLGSVPDFCDQVAVINRTVIATGATQDVFTEENLTKAFGGALRHLRLDHTDIPGSKSNEIVILTDDEAALVIGDNGRLRKVATEENSEND